jgi:hypothetical protein
MDDQRRKRGWKGIYKARARTVLNGLPIGPVRDEDAIALLSELIGMHPESDAKVGCGVARFEIRPSDVNPAQRTFWLVRLDGTSTDFSYLKCLTHPTPIQDFKAACRSAAVDRVLAFKNEAFAAASILPCAVTGVPVGPDSCHIDHAPPWTFDRIASEFALGYSEDEIRAMVRPTADGESRTVFADDATTSAFLAFHDARAVLRVVSIEVNLSVLARKGGNP